MYQLKSDSKNSLQTFKRFVFPMMVGLSFFAFSCKNDIEQINALAFNPDQPSVTINNVEFEYTDTAKLQAKLITSLVNYYLDKEEPYYEFPVGIKVLFYDQDEKVKSTITSKYAIYKVEKELFEVRDSVVSINLEENQKVETEQMFWDQKKKTIYSDVFTKITSEDGVHLGERGFEASQDLSSYKLFGSRGDMRVKDEEESTK